MQVSDFDFELPERLIAKYPLAERASSRLMHLDASSGEISHYSFRDLTHLLTADDLMVFNDTRVIRARLFAHKTTGGKVEILLERIVDESTVLAQLRVSKSPAPGAELILDDTDIKVRVDAKEGDFYRLVFPAPGVLAITDRVGHVPLPPYIDREDQSLDRDRYQTVYARREGAVAAPTAGLHFDDALMRELEAKGVDETFVTLHVGAGTFQPVRVQNIEEHRMHKEYMELTEAVCENVRACRQRDGRVVAIGTTSVRCLETASKQGEISPFVGDTDIFIYPGYEFKSVDAMVTNFHLPGSTLIMLVSAFAGLDKIKHAYEVAIAEEYRFFSYGDAMLITR
ncbi:MAG: tRNA preQ1(34) S-adenosylmethionine ribosyltransferase-isomerase QueA [Pseudomonadales bacterium]|nr:tRNA preQ1(34) S-adenosylmethionine ribosyltransferase-isomerase QueA [Pseudomonadales bacterium]